MKGIDIYTSILLIAVLIAYFSITNAIARKCLLLLISYGIYISLAHELAILLILLTLLDYSCSWGIRRRPDRKRVFLLASITGNLTILGFFKYFGFFVNSAAHLLAHFGISVPPLSLKILLPIGLSFYTFHGMSFTIDNYRGSLESMPSLLDYSLYLAFFPKLMAGPIARAGHFLPQLKNLSGFSPENLYLGTNLVILGVFKKLLPATFFGTYWERYLQAVGSLGPLETFCAGACFGLYIYFDFSGYTDIAIGSARILGFDLPANFRDPYAAMDFSDFWRRWHMTLSAWLRDYLYIPLGGSRTGTLRTYRNIMITMLLCGLWHGAAWTFVLWGGIHGVFIMASHMIKGAKLPRPLGLIQVVLVFFLLSLAWIFFGAPDWTTAMALISKIFAPVKSPQPETLFILALVLALGPTASHFKLYDKFMAATERRMGLAVIFYTVLLLAIVAQRWTGVRVNEFVYFRF